MGEVFVAEAIEPAGRVPVGGRVALKRLLLNRLDDDDALRRFLREVELGQALDHPSLVRILDSGTHDDDYGRPRPFFAMELVEGKSLRKILETEGPLSEPFLRRVAIQVADGLAALHSADIVHRDVKPGNVMIAADHDVKLGDLGIAHLARPELKFTSTGVFLGTFFYSAPELFERGPVKAACDLYSLGVLLYEAATRQCPFRADGFHEVMRLHQEHVPPRVGRLRPQLSLFFEEVVTTLLQKRPEHRFASASELAEVLGQGEDSPWWQERAAAVDRTGRRLVARRLRVRVRPDELLVGRSDALELLAEREREATGGHGQALLIEGEPGLGKTRLLAEFVDRTDGRESAVLYGGYRSASGRSGVEGLHEALFHHFGRQRLRAELARHLSEAPHQTELLERHLLGEPSEVEEGESTESTVHAAARTVLRSLSREQPLVLMLEDLHQAGEAQSAFLAPLIELVAEEAILLVLTRRPEPEKTDSLAELIARRVVEPLPLERLGRDDVERLLASILSSKRLAAQRALGVTRRTSGNPFFVVAVARDMVERGGQPQDSGPADETLPGSLRRLLLERIKGLERDADRDLLRAAAVVGSSFDPSALAAVLERPRFDVLQVLTRLERRGGLLHSTGQDFEFEHDLLREAIESDLSPALCSEFHGRIAEAHAQVLGLSLEEADERWSGEAPFLAYHLLHSPVPTAGLVWVPLALDVLWKASRNDQLLLLSHRAVEVAPKQEECLRLRIRLHQANCLELLGRREAHHGCARAALALAEACGNERLELRALAHLCHALLVRRDYVGARKLAERRLAGAEALGEPLLLARARGVMARLARLEGRLDEALDEFTLALELARRAGSELEQARLLIGLGQVQHESAELAEGRDSHREALRLARRATDPRTEASALGNLARAYLGLGELARAEELLRAHVRLSRDLGFRQGRMVSTLNLAEARLERGAYEEVRELLTEVIELSEDGKSFFADVARIYRVITDMAEGRLATASEQLAEVSRRWPEADGPLSEFLFQAESQLAWLEGRFEDAEEVLRRALSRGSDQRQQRVFKLALSVVVAARGHADESRTLACEVLDEARALGVQLELAQALMAVGRAHWLAGDGDAAAPFLREASEIVEQQAHAEPGPLPAAYLALLHEREADQVEVAEAAPVIVRAEAHLVLHLAKGGQEHLPEAKGLLDRLSEHLQETDRQRFWIAHPVARAVMDELRGGGR